MKKNILLILAALLSLNVTLAQETDTLGRFQHSVKLGIGLGGSSPVPIPNRISEMKWTPHLCVLIGYDLRYGFNDKIGVKSGLQIKHVGMTAEAKVYQMFTQAIVEDAQVSGYFTGYNETVLHATYLSLPLQFSFSPNSAWTFDAGAFFALKLQGHFSGAVKEGYIRIETPTGEKVEVGYEPFDFSEFISPFNYGVEITASRRFGSRWSGWFDLSWALNSTFKSAFRGLEYKMYNIYGFVGIDYKL